MKMENIDVRPSTRKAAEVLMDEIREEIEGNLASFKDAPGEDVINTVEKLLSVYYTLGMFEADTIE